MYEKNTNLLHNLMWQLKEYDKNLGISASITELIFLTEVFKTEGTAMCNLPDIHKSTRVAYCTLARHAASAQKRGLITYETKFRNNKTKFIELTDEGERLKARIIRLGSMTTFSDTIVRGREASGHSADINASTQSPVVPVKPML